jgi:LPS O-antigen subunit length determinant protein (WzzB/FepE family)
MKVGLTVGNRVQVYSSLAKEELARLKQATNIAEESARWLRHSVSRLRDGADIDSEIHNLEEALRAAREAFKSSPGATNGGSAVNAQHH